MRKIVIVLMFLSILTLGLFAQEFDDMEAVFGTFSDSVASVLPYASTIGLNWSDAYIGQLIDLPPHFGVGLTAGAVFMPMEGFKDVFDFFDSEIPAELSQLEKLGIPFPAYTAEVRLGGIGFPFDIGVKAGFIPEQVDLKALLGDNSSIDYLLVGADIRIPVVKQNLVLPDISIGGGFNYIRGGIGVAGLLGENIELTNFDVPNATNPETMDTHTLSLSDPGLSFGWKSTVIDLKAQVSKKILFITPYAGLGGSYGISHAGGGLTTDILLDGVELSQDDIDTINAAFEAYNEILAALGEDPVDVPALSTGEESGILVGKDIRGWSARAFGGLSFDIFILHTDLTVMYNLLSKSLGATANFRIQL